MSRTTAKARRLAELVEKLRLKPRSVVELATEFEVTQRTIQRDLHDLQAMGHSLRERQARYELPSSPGALNDVEALAVHSATRMLVHTEIGERHYVTALEKLARQLPEPARSTLAASVQRLEPRPDDRILDLVAQAWFQGRVLRCRYHSASSGTVRTNEYEIYFYEVNRRNERQLRIVRELDDGEVEVELHANLAADGDVHELTSFLLGWGPAIEVLSPTSVRERVAGDLRAAAARYG